MRPAYFLLYSDNALERLFIVELIVSDPLIWALNNVYYDCALLEVHQISYIIIVQLTMGYVVVSDLYSLLTDYLSISCGM